MLLVTNSVGLNENKSQFACLMFFKPEPSLGNVFLWFRMTIRSEGCCEDQKRLMCVHMLWKLWCAVQILMSVVERGGVVVGVGGCTHRPWKLVFL
jgi:hypothetical protein